jgi:hypothetical protein
MAESADTLSISGLPLGIATHSGVCNSQFSLLAQVVMPPSQFEHEGQKVDCSRIVCNNLRQVEALSRYCQGNGQCQGVHGLHMLAAIERDEICMGTRWSMDVVLWRLLGSANC